MPRLLPRLLDRFEKSSQQPWSKFVLPRKKTKSLYKPERLSAPSLNPVNYTKSILLTPDHHKLITSSQDYEYHKSLPPVLQNHTASKQSPDDVNAPRSMSEKEQKWWCNPYLRILSSPVRKCSATMQYLPKDFLIRFSKVRLPPDSTQNGAKGSIALIPNGLQHSKFTARDPGKGIYILCDKNVINRLKILASRIPMIDPKTIHGLIGEQVAHLLRLRVLQELELLGDAIQASTSKAGSRIMRRLTREEWKHIQETGTIPYPNAVAVIVVPPLQKDPTTGKRPEPSMSASPITEDAPKATPKKPSLPPSSLHLVEEAAENTAAHAICPHSQAKVPLYNGVMLFQNRPQRAALHMQLLRLLRLERAQQTKDQDEAQSGKSSHAFLLTAAPENIHRGDGAAVAMALWRLRMFEENSSE